MKLRYRAILAAAAVLCLTPLVLGAEDPAANQSGSFVVWLIMMSPAFFILLWLVVYIRRSGAMKHGDYMARAGEHMESIERKTDRMIELLESIDHKLSGGV